MMPNHSAGDEPVADNQRRSAHRPAHGHAPAVAPGRLSSLTPEQEALVRQFVAQVGGLENARRALEMLAILDGLA